MEILLLAYLPGMDHTAIAVELWLPPLPDEHHVT